jgi:L-fuculose-phosphate aldolase
VDERDLRCDIVEVGRRLYERGLIGGAEGNISVRREDTLFVTPAATCKGFLTPDMIVRTDLEGRPQGGARASTEILMHVAVYRRRPDVRAVVHAHPPTATAFAVAGIALDRPLIAEAVVALGPVPIIPYGQPSTTELAEHVGSGICGAQALLMANHGAIAVGESLFRAWERMETIEQLAKIALTTRLLGAEFPLPAAAVSELSAQRARAGYPEPVCAPGAGSAAGGPPPAAAPAPALDAALAAERVTLTRAELVRLVQDAVERFSRRA